MTQYVVITSVRDGEEHIAATIEFISVPAVRPTKCVRLDDGSTDRTGILINRIAT